MKSIEQKIEESFIRRDFLGVIDLGEKYLGDAYSREDQARKGDVYIKLGWSYDQAALTIKSSQRRAAFQKKAVAYFKKARKYDEVSFLRGMGTVCHHRHDPRGALLYYQKALATNPRDPSFHNDIGNAYRRWGEISVRKRDEFNKLAEFYYKKAIKLTHASRLKLSPIINLGLFYESIGNFREARVYAKRALKIVDGSGLKDYVPVAIKRRIKSILNKG